MMINVKGVGGGFNKVPFLSMFMDFVYLFVVSYCLIFLWNGRTGDLVASVFTYSSLFCFMLFSLMSASVFTLSLYLFVILLFTCCFFLFFIKSSLGRGSIGRSYL